MIYGDSIAPGARIKSVTLTPSYEDGGTNTITVNMTDGGSYEFPVANEPASAPDTEDIQFEVNALWSKVDALEDTLGTVLSEGGAGYTETDEEGIETIHTIDPKYLPGVCLPVVELSTEPTGIGVLLTAEENALMNKVSAMDAPCVVKFISDEGSTMSTAVACKTKAVSENSFVYAAPMGEGTLLIMNEGREWVAQIVP